MITHNDQIDKKHVAAITIFAIKHIPETDEPTLMKFLEMVNVNGSFGWISADQLLEKMRLLMRYVPGTCPQSLLILIDLLAVHLPLAVGSGDTNSLLTGQVRWIASVDQPAPEPAGI